MLQAPANNISTLCDKETHLFSSCTIAWTQTTSDVFYQILLWTTLE